MKRREALKATGLLMAFLGSSSAITILNSCSSEPRDDWKPSFIASENMKSFSSLVDTFLPGDKNYPSGTSVGLHRFVDSFANDCLPQKMKNALKEGVSALFQSFEEKTGGSFADADPETRFSFLQNILMQETAKDSDEMPAISMLRYMLAYGYTTSEKVCKEVLVYDPIPGPYQGVIDLSETNGKRYAPINRPLNL